KRAIVCEQSRRTLLRYRNQLKLKNFLVRPERLELPAYWFEASRSIQLSYGRTLRPLYKAEVKRAVESPWDRWNIMKTPYLTCWLLGAWIAGSLFMILVATQNFRSVDRLLAAPAGAAVQVEKIGREEARTFLRYQVSEQNRWYFETWEKIQLALGLALLAVTFRQDRASMALAAIMFALLLAQRFWITPEIVRIGR